MGIDTPVQLAKPTPIKEGKKMSLSEYMARKSANTAQGGYNVLTISLPEYKGRMTAIDPADLPRESARKGADEKVRKSVA
jgi:hypothetical protein